jgi:hypothetical protein
MNVEIGAEAALFPEKEYIKGFFVAVTGKPLFIYDFAPDLKFLIYEEYFVFFLISGCPFWGTVPAH